ncbi:hypothetical protein LJC55_02275 [Eubacteriales bacterium OttesenSCG-928-N14]|nr:hypothetical protein [Eubacteriales bacterium OttesenSCG-928-N14]
MQRIYTTEHTILATECDLTRMWKMPAIFIAMQEVADLHARQLGIARDNLRPLGMIWMIARTRVQMQRYPKHGDTIKISTYPGMPDRVGFPRYFIFEDMQGNQLGVASSLWMIVDTQTLRLMSPAKANLTFPDTSDIAPSLEIPKRERLDLEGARESLRIPTYNDIDMNDHVNNTRYVEWVTDLFDAERYKHQMLASLQVNYIAQTKFGQQVKIHCKEQGNDFVVSGSDAHRENALFEAMGSFIDRDEPIAILP